MRNAFWILAIVGLGFTGLVVAEENDADVLAAFAEHVQSQDSIGADAKTEVQQILNEYGADAASDAITESLIVIHEKYSEAIEASDGEDVEIAAAALSPFAESDDEYLAADAAFYLARMLMNNEQYERATPLLEKIHGDWSDYNVHVGNARFYTGVAQAGLLKYTEAIQTFKDFLQFYPTAPERLRVAAWRQVQQLREIKAGQMDDIYQRMDYSRRKLSLIDPGEETQSEQKKIVGMLGKLIKAQEKKEASSKNKDKKNTQKQQQQKPQQQQQQQQSQNGKQSKSQKGGKSNQANGQAVRKAYNDGPQSPWSRLRDRSRDPANNAIKDKFPARYRDLIERYYEAANGDSNK